jgi:uncharacterized protein (TIGR03437 family)
VKKRFVFKSYIIMSVRFSAFLAVFFCVFAVVQATAQVPINPSPSRSLGHAKLTLTSAEPNLVDGKELNAPHGVAVDTVNNILYVADTFNNRVLAWRNASGFQTGAPASFVVGQRDRQTTFTLGPGSNFSSGLFGPMAVAVDSAGNLFVADAGNNRIVRYPTPYTLADDAVRLADFVIGQSSLNSRTPNFTGSPSERSLALSSSQGFFRTGLVFDPQGNLWATDGGNNRVLRYPAGSLAEGAQNGPNANLVLGQPDFRTTAPLQINPLNRANKQRTVAPGSVTMDQGGRVFVVDALSRVVVYAPPYNSGADAARIMGVVVVPQGQPLPATPINETSLGIAESQNSFTPPEGVFTIGNTPFVIDTPSHRILRFDPFDQWAPEATTFSPPARATIGQDAVQQSTPAVNRGLAEPTPGSFAFPVSAVFAGGLVYVADTGNNRVLVFGDLSTGPPLASGEPYRARRVAGQRSFEFRAPNQIEGREFSFGGRDIIDGRDISAPNGAGIAVDKNSTPPRLYVADPVNNRVLGFADARRVRPGDRADIVIGQPDCQRRMVNFPSNRTSERNANSLFFPVGVAVDAAGNLWVADNGNGRVLRFPTPFSRAPACEPGGAPLEADVVLGQANFTTRATDATDRTLGAPYGLAFSNEGHLFVSDSGHNRVMLFSSPFTNGKPASRVFGQPNFDTTASGNQSTDNRFNSPRGIGIDTDDRLYVCDSGNNRILIFSRAPLAGPDPRAAFQLIRGLNAPFGLAVSALSGDIWVANSGTTGNNAIVRYPKFDTLTAAGDATNYSIASGAAAIAVAVDAFDNVITADVTHRLAFYFPIMVSLNAANYKPRLPANTISTGEATPGMIASIYPFNYRFGERTMQFTEAPNPLPVPTELADIQVLVNDVPAPLFLVAPTQINLVVPMNAPSSGTAEFQVVQVSTGRILAAAQVSMRDAQPGLFTSAATGSGIVAAINEDGATHSLQARVGSGTVLSLFGTGQGFIPGAPPDGVPASGPVETPDRPRVFVNAREADVLYSGLAPGLVGVWQINIRIPAGTAPNLEVPIVVSMRDTPSGIPSNPNLIRPTVATR